MSTEILVAMPSKSEMATVLNDRMVQLEFDYDSAGVDGITQTQLENVAEDMFRIESVARKEVVEAYLHRGHCVKKALSLFGKAAEGNGWEWLQDRCGLTKRQASDALAVWNLFHDRNLEAVNKFAPTTLAFLARFSEHKRFITNALQLAESVDREIPLSVVKGWVEEDGEPKEEISFGVAVPKTIDEAKAWVVKKVRSASKRWPSDIVGELPEVLRLAAYELDEKYDQLDSPEEDEGE